MYRTNPFPPFVLSLLTEEMAGLGKFIFSGLGS